MNEEIIKNAKNGEISDEEVEKASGGADTVDMDLMHEPDDFCDQYGPNPIIPVAGLGSKKCSTCVHGKPAVSVGVVAAKVYCTSGVKKIQ